MLHGRAAEHIQKRVPKKFPLTHTSPSDSLDVVPISIPVCTDVTIFFPTITKIMCDV